MVSKMRECEEEYTRRDKNQCIRNTGFSLVELIIVIAIMAILAAAIAPALIRYINKARKADDIATADALGTTFKAAITENEAFYDYVAKSASYISNDTDQKYRVVTYMNAGYQNWTYRGTDCGDSALNQAANAAMSKTIGELMGQEVFKLKFTLSRYLDQWLICVDKDCNFYVFAGGGFGTGMYFLQSDGRTRGGHEQQCYMLWPEVSPAYEELTTPNDVPKSF